MPKGIFTKLGKKVRNVFVWSSITIGFLLVLDFLYLQDKCILEKAVESEKIQRYNSKKLGFRFYCKSSQIIANIYNSLLVSIITLVFIELTLHPESIKEIKKIYNASQATRYIKSFYRNNNEYNDEIRKKIRELKNDEEVKLLGLVKDIDILTTSIDQGQLIEKLKKGCKIKILLVYPSLDNSLLRCLQNSHQNLKYEDENTIITKLKYFLTIADTLERNLDLDIKGEIEVRLQKNTYSSICYFSTKLSSGDSMAFIWMYFFGSTSLEYPAFEILEPELLNDVERHFEHLWSKSPPILTYHGQQKLSNKEKNNELKINCENLRKLCKSNQSNQSNQST